MTRSVASSTVSLAHAYVSRGKFSYLRRPPPITSMHVCIYPVSLVIELVYRFKYQIFGIGTLPQQILNRIFEISVIKRIPLVQV